MLQKDVKSESCKQLLCHIRPLSLSAIFFIFNDAVKTKMSKLILIITSLPLYKAGVSCLRLFI